MSAHTCVHHHRRLVDQLPDMRRPPALCGSAACRALALRAKPPYVPLARLDVGTAPNVPLARADAGPLPKMPLERLEPGAPAYVLPARLEVVGAQ